MHTLQKEPAKRTSTVEDLAEEMKNAVYPPAIGIHTTSGGTLPISSLRIRSNPGQARIYVDSVPVGQTRDSGWLMLEGIQSGNHNIRLSRDGYEDWIADLQCDGQPQQVVAEMRELFQMTTPAMAIPKPGAVTGSIPVPIPTGEAVTKGFSESKDSNPSLQKTVAQRPVQTGDREVAVSSPPPKKRSFVSPLVLGIGALILLAGLAVLGIAGAFALGFIGRPATNVSASPSPSLSPSPALPTKAEMVLIPGGTFKMGNDKGRPNEQPEHEVTVAPFKMDKTEVTNAEFLEFMNAGVYKPASIEKFLGDWANGKPLAGQERLPVRYVSLADAKAFAEWRSKRDHVSYRLPTEAEWEFAARNGSKENLYPWGDKFDSNCAVIDGITTEPVTVTSKTCPNDWGVEDLIGNVWEWTSSEISLYPGNSSGSVAPHDKPIFMIRGGSYFEKSTGPAAINATFRADVAADRREPNIGFRLVSNP
jgi:formylglycine-generating enzyme required for sulfatase activity